MTRANSEQLKNTPWFAKAGAACSIVPIARFVGPNIFALKGSGYGCLFSLSGVDEEGLDAEVAYRADEVDMPLARVISEHGMRQFHTAETEKYAHVTYFINGRRETPFPGEDRVLVPSPKVATYDLQPEMSAAGVTDTAIEHIRGGEYDLVIMNYANADMVGHTGVIEAAIKAVEAVDTGVGRVVEAVLAVGGGVLITADHGNAEQLIEYDTGKPFTAHTTYPVPVYCVVPQLAQAHLRSDGILADISPTILQIMGIQQPKDMQGHSLIHLLQ